MEEAPQGQVSKTMMLDDLKVASIRLEQIEEYLDEINHKLMRINHILADKDMFRTRRIDVKGRRGDDEASGTTTSDQ